MAKATVIGPFVISVADLCAMLFGLAMLAITLRDVSTPGTHGALIGVIAFGSIAIPVMVFLLLATLGALAIRYVPGADPNTPAPSGSPRTVCTSELNRE